MRAYRAALCLVVRSRALLVFDEAEDVFAVGWNFLAPPSPAQTSKAWVNRTLEGNPVPCLWLSNAIGDMDPAFIRRFDVVYELPIPPRRHRARLIEGLCLDLAPPAVIGRLASSEHLTPAVIARAATVARTLRDEVPPEALPAVLTRLIDHTLMAQGHPWFTRRERAPLPLLPAGAREQGACGPLRGCRVCRQGARSRVLEQLAVCCGRLR